MEFQQLEYGYKQNITKKTKILNFFRKVFFISVLEKMLVALNQVPVINLLIRKLIPNHYQYKKGTIRKCERHGVKYKLDLSELVDWWVYFNPKDDSREELLSYVKEGYTVLDIGANMGEVSFSFSKKVGKKGKVISFEPDPINYARFEANDRLNSFENITLVKKGLGAVSGTFEMAMNDLEPGNNGSNRILHHGNKVSNNLKRQVDVVTLDEWMKNNVLDGIDLIKIDIEGYELEALKGAKETLSKHQPKIFTELHDAKLKEHGSSAKELVQYLKSLGYELSSEDGVNLECASLSDLHTDLICIPSSE